MFPEPWDPTDGKYINTLDDEQLLTVIKKGGASVKRSSLLPAWGGYISDEQIRKVIAHLRSRVRPPCTRTGIGKPTGAG